MNTGKVYKYYVVRIGGLLVFRRSLLGIRKVTSKIYKPGTEFVMSQSTWTGGIVIGSMPYSKWYSTQKKQIASGGAIKITKDVYVSMLPYVTKGV